jgi:hypothetical protein
VDIIGKCKLLVGEGHATVFLFSLASRSLTHTRFGRLEVQRFRLVHRFVRVGVEKAPFPPRDPAGGSAAFSNHGETDAGKNAREQVSVVHPAMILSGIRGTASTQTFDSSHPSFLLRGTRAPQAHHLVEQIRDRILVCSFVFRAIAGFVQLLLPHGTGSQAFEIRQHHAENSAWLQLTITLTEELDRYLALQDAPKMQVIENIEGRIREGMPHARFQPMIAGSIACSRR